MKTRNLYALGTALALFASACSVPKNVTYFQDLDAGAVVKAENELKIRVKPEDKLLIMVTTQDPALSALFNLVQVQNRLSSTTSSTYSVLNTSINNEGRTSYYTVDSGGYINFPIIGRIHIAGMDREEVANCIVTRLVEQDLVKDPIVTVEFVNTGISVLGAVKTPGRYEFNKDHLTIIDGLAMAGDLNLNGVRENVLVMRRNGDGDTEVFRINLTDAAQTMKSPAFFLQQDDVIYVEFNDKEKRNTTPNGNSPYTPSFWVSMGSFAVTIVTLVITLTN